MIMVMPFSHSMADGHNHEVLASTMFYVLIARDACARILHACLGMLYTEHSTLALRTYNMVQASTRAIGTGLVTKACNKSPSTG